MVYVNSKKFACESCIKGHRSSSCHHTDRPLFEIKKKGRPVSQCAKCRELRQSKKFHSKCTCNHSIEEAPAMQPLASSSGAKTKRFIPIVPALPNGLRDVLGRSSSSQSFPVDSRQTVNSLLNPCDCKTLWNCQCDAKTTSPSVPAYASRSTDALSTLARAAATMSSCCGGPSSTDPGPSRYQRTLTASKEIPRSRSPDGPPNHASHERHKKHPSYQVSTPGPDLAPILYIPSSPLASTSIPNFPSMPPMSEFTSLAGSGCTCGVKCACPGCAEHQGISATSDGRRNCADGCGTCIDPSLGMALPSPKSSQTSTSILDRFFATAAALPPPPTHRKTSSYHLDPMNTTVYSPSMGQQIFPFGSVTLPKLECCGGQCNCPDGRCHCRASCVGCCRTTVSPSVAPSEINP